MYRGILLLTRDSTVAQWYRRQYGQKYPLVIDRNPRDASYDITHSAFSGYVLDSDDQIPRNGHPHPFWLNMYEGIVELTGTNENVIVVSSVDAVLRKAASLGIANNARIKRPGLPPRDRNGKEVMRFKEKLESHIGYLLRR